MLDSYARLNMDNQHEEEVEKMATAFRRVLSEGLPEEEGQRSILIKRIPIICADILQMKANLQWIKWLVVGITGGIGALIVMILANKL